MAGDVSTNHRYWKEKAVVWTSFFLTLLSGYMI